VETDIINQLEVVEAVAITGVVEELIKVLEVLVVQVS
jgi:hypothetical protein